jgi:hypothetical protein
MTNLTLHLVSFYKKCNPSFKYVYEMRDNKKVITEPSNAVQNDFLDNAMGDYVFHVGEEIYDTDAISSLKFNRYVGLFCVFVKGLFCCR